ncbi:succinate dehydrogenase/fumarate reductase flavo protein subunit [Hyaloscypha variabilis F]|uniref:Succinate dehydrogenase/fumarate reductase flavo protein subunit n=1 Tax=Hyaloscypha variabilis (strain UAMH 11265 / GT02V1 / F) TaxID=1149755 RepID=A0A2J6QTC1_HYAVF|nr:succinate dehydrogenase/fumarate reductase flavo protein subunit [Hyaloscypha variabilis F]
MAYLRLDKNLNFDKDWVKEMKLVRKGLADLGYCAELGEIVPSLARYLEDRGVTLNHHDEKNVLLEFDTDQHFVFPEGGGNAIIQKMFEHMQSYDNLDVLWETEATKLLTSPQGAISGVKVRKPDGLLYELNAPNVMLACGGFEGNQEMLIKYVGNRTVDLPLIAPGLKYNRGAGLNMALELGAGTAGSLDGMHCELVDTRATKPDAVVWGHNYGIVVNKDCKRFYDEGKRHLFATFEMIDLETWRDQSSEAYFVTDSTIMDRFRPGWVYDTSDVEPFKANSITELAKLLKIDPQKLEATVNEFNAVVNDKPFDLMRLDGKATTGLSPNKTNWANPINKAPYYGVPMTSHLTFTYGGLKVDTESRVLSTNGVPIPGLYAAGELTGLFYHEYPPATSCLRSMAFGREAGIAIAKKLGKTLPINGKH